MSSLLMHGDCLEMLKDLPDDSIDAIVTDPPYGLSFMGKKWDYDVPSVDVWKEALRVLKPGGHVLSFGGTRTYHRMVVNIEDAGFEIRDQVMWIYGSGFPKSHDVSKGIDKASGAERVTVGKNPNHRSLAGTTTHGDEFQPHTSDGSITAPSTEAAKQWQGWGTALKPANEPICLARKPLVGTVAKNVQEFGTGAINIDASRIGTEVRQNAQKDSSAWHGNNFGAKPQTSNGVVTEVQGRWPANVLFDEEAAALLGEPSRFFYVAKSSKRERNAGLEGMPEKATHRYGAGIGEGSDPNAPSNDKNHHPTVKPIKLMEYLVRMITPPGGVVLDPFMGSGTTGIAAKKLGFDFIGIEREAEYIAIAEKRIG